MALLSEPSQIKLNPEGDETYSRCISYVNAPGKDSDESEKVEKSVELFNKIAHKVYLKIKDILDGNIDKNGNTIMDYLLIDGANQLIYSTDEFKSDYEIHYDKVKSHNFIMTHNSEFLKTYLETKLGLESYSIDEKVYIYESNVKDEEGNNKKQIYIIVKQNIDPEGNPISTETDDYLLVYLYDKLTGDTIENDNNNKCIRIDDNCRGNRFIERDKLLECYISKKGQCIITNDGFDWLLEKDKYKCDKESNLNPEASSFTMPGSSLNPKASSFIMPGSTLQSGSGNKMIKSTYKSKKIKKITKSKKLKSKKLGKKKKSKSHKSVKRKKSVEKQSKKLRKQSKQLKKNTKNKN